MKRLMNWEFWDKAIGRALRTTLQVSLGLISGCAVIQDINWAMILSTAGVTILSSFLTSMIAVLPEESNQ